MSYELRLISKIQFRITTLNIKDSELIKLVDELDSVLMRNDLGVY